MHWKLLEKNDACKCMNPVSIEWIPTDQNIADHLTRNTGEWLQIAELSVAEEKVMASNMGCLSANLVMLEEIVTAQRACLVILEVLTILQHCHKHMPKVYQKTQSQFVV